MACFVFSGPLVPRSVARSDGFRSNAFLSHQTKADESDHVIKTYFRYAENACDAAISVRDETGRHGSAYPW